MATNIFTRLLKLSSRARSASATRFLVPLTLVSLCTVFLLLRRTQGTCAHHYQSVPLIVVTAADQSPKTQNMTCRYLLESAAATNTTLVLLTHEGPYGGNLFEHSHIAKHQLVPRWLDRNCISDDQVVLFLDSTDTILQKSASQIYLSYLEMGSPKFLLTAEQKCGYIGPHDCAMFPFPPLKLPTRFLNSGGFIGKVGAVKKYLQDAADYYAQVNKPGSLIPPQCYGEGGSIRFPYSDQALMACSFVYNNPYNMSLDYMSQLFFSAKNADHNLQQKPSSHYKPGSLYFDSRTGFTPAVIHHHHAYRYPNGSRQSNSEPDNPVKLQKLEEFRKHTWYYELANADPNNFYGVSVLVDDKPVSILEHCKSYLQPTRSS